MKPAKIAGKVSPMEALRYLDDVKADGGGGIINDHAIQSLPTLQGMAAYPEDCIDRVKEKAVVLAMSFVLFMGGVFALSMDRGNGRTIVLVFVVLALLAIAARQTIRSLKKKKE